MARSRGIDWILDDVEILSRDHPKSFFIPSAERRRSLRPDDVVKLVFRVTGDRTEDPSGERMWVTDIRVTEAGRYVGVLMNSPTAIGDLHQRDEVEFGPEHVAAVTDPEAVPDYIRAFASRRLIEDEALLPRYVYHDPSELERAPNSDGDRSSGWCLMVGDETDEEVSDARNLLLPSLGWLVERYPAFGALVRSSPGGREYGWDDEQACYVDLGPYQGSEA